MKHISILVPEGAILGSVEGPRMVFTEVNQFLKRIGKPPLFKVELIGLSKAISLCNGNYTIRTDALIIDMDKTDLIIIPALDGDIVRSLKDNHDFVPWIKEQYKKGAEVASLCLGAFLLASTGLITGKQCTTHWMATSDFRKMFPEVNLAEGKVITDEHGIYSSGGAFSYLNLILYLVEKYAGREIAVFCSKVFQIDIQRSSQSAFIMFTGEKEHEDAAIRKAQEFIEANFRNKITVEELASMTFLSRRNFERRFKKATFNTAVEYIQRVKIEAAKINLESSRENVNEVMYNVGYSDSKAFRTAFKKFTGLSPIQYRNQYNKEAAVSI